MKKSEDYEVGYRKPPKNTRFEKGQSGNRAGRPKGQISQDLKAIVNRVLAKSVTMTERGGRKKRVSYLEGVITKLANLAATDPRAFKQLMQLYLQVNGKELAEAGKEPLPWTDDDGVVGPEI